MFLTLRSAVICVQLLQKKTGNENLRLVLSTFQLIDNTNTYEIIFLNVIQFWP
jgi:hypothetical protein